MKKKECAATTICINWSIKSCDLLVHGSIWNQTQYSYQETIFLLPFKDSFSLSQWENWKLTLVLNLWYYKSCLPGYDLFIQLKLSFQMHHWFFLQHINSSVHELIGKWNSSSQIRFGALTLVSSFPLSFLHWQNTSLQN